MTHRYAEGLTKQKYIALRCHPTCSGWQCPATKGLFIFSPWESELLGRMQAMSNTLLNEWITRTLPVLLILLFRRTLDPMRVHHCLLWEVHMLLRFAPILVWSVLHLTTGSHAIKLTIVVKLIRWDVYQCDTYGIVYLEVILNLIDGYFLHFQSQGS